VRHAECEKPVPGDRQIRETWRRHGEVVVALGDIEIVSAITRVSAEALNLQPGDEVKAIIKSTEVIIDK
jgi:molybdopterin-binding protein